MMDVYFIPWDAFGNLASFNMLEPHGHPWSSACPQLTHDDRRRFALLAHVSGMLLTRWAQFDFEPGSRPAPRAGAGDRSETNTLF